MPVIETVNIYCSCRLPYVLEHPAKRDAKDDTQMLYCDCCQKWYHFSCIGIRKDEKKIITNEKSEEKWIGPDCVNRLIWKSVNSKHAGVKFGIFVKTYINNLCL